MMNIPVAASRLIMPEMPQCFFLTDSINALYSNMQNKHAVVVNAPAGYGKTAFLSTFFTMHSSGNSRVCWYSLEQEDVNPEVFFSYLTGSLFPAGKKEWEAARRALEPYGNIQTQLHHINSTICRELWSIHSTDKFTKTYIVFDDFHHVCLVPEVISTVGYLLNNLPPNFTIIMSSRYKTNIFTEKQKLNKYIYEITSDDLCFSEKEVALFLDNIPSFRSNKNLVREIIDSTEGWIAGIVMICRILKNKNLNAFDSIIEKSEHREVLFNYFSCEILKTIDTHLIAFLLKATLLREFTVTEAAAILDIENVPQLVDQCERMGLFIQKVPVANAAAYRFHPLFREAVRKARHQFLSEDDVKFYNQKAASYFIERKVYSKAIEHLLDSNDLALINEILIKESISLNVIEAIDQLRLLFELLPQNRISDHEVILYLKGLTCRHDCFEESLEALKQAFTKSEHKDCFLLRLKIAQALVYVYNYRNDIKEIKKVLAQIQKPSLIVNNTSLENAVVVFDMLKALFEDKLGKAEAISEKVNVRHLDPDLKWLFWVNCCMLNYRLGNQDKAIEFVKEALGLKEVTKVELSRGHAYLYYSIPLLLKNETLALQPILNEVISIGRKYDFGYLIGNGEMISAYVKYLKHDINGALESLNDAISCFEWLGNLAMSAFAKLIKHLWISKAEKREQMPDEAEKALDTLHRAHAGYELLEIGQSIMGAIASASGDYATAEQCLLNSIQSSAKKKARQVTCGSYIHASKLYFDMGDAEKGRAYLTKAFDLASSNHYFMFWDIHHPSLIEAAARSIKASVNTDYASRLIEKIYGEEAAKLFINEVLTTHMDDIGELSMDFVSAYSTKILRAPKIEACFLGKFVLKIGPRIVSDEEWKTKKAKGILEVLLLNKSKVVSRDRLMEIFWPESDKKAAALSLRVALYELKKVLLRYDVSLDATDGLIKENAFGLEIQESDSIKTDIDKFLQLYSKLKKTFTDTFDNKYRIGILEKMTSIYKGTLLEDEMYEDWIFFERETLNTIYIDAATKLASIYLEESDFDKAEMLLLKLLSMDRYNEEAVLHLIRLYILTNRRGHAVNFYSSFKKRLEGELGIKIDGRLVSAINDIKID